MSAFIITACWTCGQTSKCPKAVTMWAITAATTVKKNINYVCYCYTSNQKKVGTACKRDKDKDDPNAYTRHNLDVKKRCFNDK